MGEPELKSQEPETKSMSIFEFEKRKLSKIKHKN